MLKVPDECYREYGSDLDGCSTQEREGCGSCILAKQTSTRADRIKQLHPDWSDTFIEEMMYCRCYEPQPHAVDTVPVVRCKDCRFLGDENLGLHDCDHYRGPMRVELDDFCSYGERKETD